MIEPTRLRTAPLLAAATASWMAMIVADLATRTPYQFHLGHLTSLNVDEFLVAALVGLPPAFAFVACVYALVALTADRLRLSTASMFLCFVPAVPLSAAGLWLISHALWSRGRTFTDDFAAFTRDGGLALVLFLVSLCAGSVVFVAVLNRLAARQRSTVVQPPHDASDGSGRGESCLEC
jgi:hypothetical protein